MCELMCCSRRSFLTCRWMRDYETDEVAVDAGYGGAVWMCRNEQHTEVPGIRLPSSDGRDGTVLADIG